MQKSAENIAVVEFKKTLVNELLNALEKKELSQQEVRDIANYTLDNLKDDTDEEALGVFLENLAAKWPLFEPLNHVNKAKASVDSPEKEQEVISKLEQYIKSLA